MTADVQRQIAAAKGQKQPTTPLSPVQHTDVAETKRKLGKPKEKTPADKQVVLPPPPPDAGPWVVGHWTVRRTTTYEPAARVALTGPADEFEQLLAHLQAFKP